MKKTFRLFMLVLLMIMGTTTGWAEFADFGVDLRDASGGIITSDEASNAQTITFGLAVSEAQVSRVASDASNAVAVITGKTGNNHGLQNFSATVPVDGPVEITMSTCSWGNAVTVKDGNGADAVSAFTTKKGDGGSGCYKGNGDADENVIAVKYVGEATTLTISGGGYVGWFSVKAIDASSCSVSYSLGDVVCQGTIVPAGGSYAKGDKYTFPIQNHTLYKEGYTLTGWTDGTTTYEAGQEITLENDLALTPVFTENTVSLADRTEETTIKWNFRRDQGAPTVAFQNVTGVWVAQANVNGSIIDVKADFDTNNGGKFANGNWTDWAQLNNGTKIAIPSCKGAVVSMEAFNSITTTTIDGQTSYESNKTISYEVGNKSESVEVVIGDGSYYRYIQVVLPVVSEGEIKEKAIIDTNFQDWTKSSASSEITTNFSNENITFTYVNTSVDPDATNEGKFPTSDDPAYKGYIMCEKKEATVTTTAFDNITKIRYRHGATGSNRGWGLKVKGDGDADWVLISDAVTSAPTWIEKDINRKNVQLQWYNLNTGQNAYMFELEVYANVLITAEQVTLTTAVSPEGSGTVTVTPYSSEYDKDSEVTLKAEKKFGYAFKQWTKGDEVIGNEPTLTYTIAENSTITAEFVPVNTYELKYSVDGTNKYMVQPTPAPEMVDGKMMYEEGTKVTLEASQYEGLVTFNNWSDGQTTSSITVDMNEDVDITAVYSQADIIAGWDFYKAGNNGRVADFSAADNEADALSLVKTGTTTTASWLDKSTEKGGGYESFKGAAVNWQAGSTEGDVGNFHWQTKVNAEAFTDIKVQFQMLYNYNAYQTYNAEYSLDGENWTAFGSVAMSGAKTPASFSETLPEACNNQASLYIRMIADRTSGIDGASSKNDGNTLAMFFITGTPKIIDDGTAPVMLSSVPVEGSDNASANGKVVLTFDEKVKVAEGATATLNDLVLTPKVSGKTVVFEYKGLSYSTDYTFTLPANSVADLTDNYIQEAITINFTTMTRPTVEKSPYDVTVSTVDELKAAINTANTRADQNTRFRIFIKNGTYVLPRGAMKHYRHTNSKSGAEEVVYYEGDEKDPITYINASNVSFIGESRDGVIITNDEPDDLSFSGAYGVASIFEGIGSSDVFQISSTSSGLYWQDLTVSTGMSDGRGRDIAIQDKGKKNIYKNVCLHGYQDTWTSNNNNGLYFFDGGIIRGRTDYICGKGDIYFKEVEFQQIAGGYCAVPSQPANIGWVMKDCVINGDGDGVDGNYTLGRPWGSGTPVALWIDTKMNVIPSAVGWNEMSGGWPARFAEYNSTTASGSSVSLEGRKKVFAETHQNNPVLTSDEASYYSDMSNMFGDWDPTLATEQAPMVQNVVLNGNTLSWDDSNYASLYAIVKNGEVVDFTTENTYDISTVSTQSLGAKSDVTTTSDEWAVRAANEMGGLGEATVAKDPTAVEIVEAATEAKAAEGAFVIDGKVVILKAGKQFNAAGARIK